MPNQARSYNIQLVLREGLLSRQHASPPPPPQSSSFILEFLKLIKMK
jgi:hypothetical protein